MINDLILQLLLIHYDKKYFKNFDINIYDDNNTENKILQYYLCNLNIPTIS